MFFDKKKSDFQTISICVMFWVSENCLFENGLSVGRQYRNLPSLLSNKYVIFIHKSTSPLIVKDRNIFFNLRRKNRDNL